LCSGSLIGRLAFGRVLSWVFYPEGVLLGSSQMREPFFILFFAIITWSISHWFDRRRLKLAIPVFLISATSLLLFSFRVAAPILGIVLLWVWAVESAKVKKEWIKIAGWVVIGVGAIAAGWLIRGWVAEVLRWDILQTVTASGRVQFQLESLPTWLHFPFILIYGIFQPVLPAAIAAPAPWIWRSLGIFRALGWYAVLPLLAYALIRVWREESVTIIFYDINNHSLKTHFSTIFLISYHISLVKKKRGQK